jgi:hypothetical protein
METQSAVLVGSSELDEEVPHSELPGACPRRRFARTHA